MNDFQILAPTWEQLAKSLTTSEVNIAKIDCTIHRSICNNFEVKGYPTLIWIENGKKVMYIFTCFYLTPVVIW